MIGVSDIPDTKHVRVRSMDFHCLNCGNVQYWRDHSTIPELIDQMREYEKTHRECEKP